MKTTKKKFKLILTVLVILTLSIGFFFYKNTPEVAEAGWWNDSWSYRKSLTINSDKVISDLTNFPVMVSITDSSLSAHAQEDGDDFIFTDIDGNKLSHEIEDYASSTGSLVAWVRMPSLSSSIDTDIFVYYGNASASDQSNATDVWDEHYKGVWHLNEATSTDRLDSTINANTLSDNNSVGRYAGKIGQSALTLSANSEYLSRSNAGLNGLNISGSGKNLTLSGWVLRVSDSGNSEAIVGMWEYGNNDRQYLLNVDLTDAPSTSLSDNGTDFAAANGGVDVTTLSWHYIVGTYDGSNLRLYLDGNLDTGATNPESATDPINSSAGDFAIGAYFNSGTPTRFWNGLLDEVRVSASARSAEWIETEFNNQNDPSAFFAEGVEEVGPGPVGYWSFDEGYGTTAHDESGQGNNGAITGAVWRGDEECVVGKCMYFDGTNDYVNMGDVTELNSTDELSISLWFKDNDSADNNYTILFEKWIDDNNDISSGISNTNFYFEIGDAGNDYAYIEDIYSIIEKNKWYHVEYVYDGSEAQDADRAKVFINGIERQLVFNSSFPLATGDLRGDEFEISSNRHPWIGFIDEVKIYPYARTDEQIKQDYNAGLSGVKANSGVSASFGGSSDKWMSDGLVGYWKFDEAAGTYDDDGGYEDAIDSSGNGNTGDADYNASTTAGKFGNSVVFDGTGDALDLVDIGAVENHDASFCFWFNMDNLADGDLLTKGIHTTSASFLMWSDISVSSSADVGGNNTNAMCVMTCDGTTCHWVGSPSNTLSADRWIHTCAVIDETNDKISIYIDGELSVSHSKATNGIQNTSSIVKVGNAYSPSAPFDGKIDDVRIYDRVLSSSEVRKLYEWAPGPVAHWKFDEKTGTTAYDSVASSSIAGGNNGTISGAEWIRGVYGSALEFGAGSDIVDCGSKEVLDNLGQRTVCGWVKPTGGAGSWQVLFDKSANGLTGWNLYLSSTNIIAFYQGFTSGAVNVETTFSLTTNVWQHLCYTYDGEPNADGLKIYVDGVSITVPADTAGSSIRSDDSSYSFNIGNDATFSYDSHQQIDDVKVYNYIRTQKQIIEDMMIGLENRTSHYFKFDEGYGSTAHNDGFYTTISGTLMANSTGGNTNATQMWSKDGKLGGAIEFDGTNDAVYLFDASPYYAGTISFWMRPDWDSSYTATTRYVTGVYDSGAGDLFAVLFCGEDAYCEGGGAGTAGEFKFFTVNSGSIQSEVGVVGSDYSWQAGEWVHVAITWDDSLSTGDMRMFMNGIEPTITRYNEGSLDTSVISSDDFNIGAIESTGLAAFDGLIDEYRVYAYALSSDEIKELYNGNKNAVMGSDTSRDNNGTAVTGVSRDYCVPGDTAQCDAPVLELAMDEKNGANTYDMSGNGNDGSITGATWSRGIQGSALFLDGTGDSVDITNTSELNFGNGDAFTISTWAKYSGAATSQSIFRSSTNSNRWYLERRSDNYIYFYVRPSGASYAVNNTTSLDDGKWHYITGVRDTSGDLFLYVDGLLVDSGVNAAGDVSDSMDYRIGGRQDSTEMFIGNVDGFRIYNYERTPAQIAWDYNRGKPVAHWSFDECSGDTIHDESGNSENLMLMVNPEGTTATGTCASSSNSFWYNGREGKYGAASSWNGEVAIMASSTKAINADSDHTWSFWAKPNAFIDGGTVYSTIGEVTLPYMAMNIMLHTTNDVNFGPVQKGISIWWGDMAMGDNYLVVHSLDNVINTDRFYLVVIKYDSSKSQSERLSIYVDGKDVTDVNDVLSYGTLADISANIQFFGMNLGSPEDNYNGLVDDFKIWNYGLTLEQIKNEYNGGAVRFGN